MLPSSENILIIVVDKGVSLESKLLFIEVCFSYMAHLLRSELC